MTPEWASLIAGGVFAATIIIRTVTSGIFDNSYDGNLDGRARSVAAAVSLLVLVPVSIWLAPAVPGVIRWHVENAPFEIGAGPRTFGYFMAVLSGIAYLTSLYINYGRGQSNRALRGAEKTASSIWRSMLAGVLGCIAAACIAAA